MKIRTVLLGAIATLCVEAVVSAANIDRATLTEVVNSVNIIEPASKKTSSAKVQQLFLAPNVLRTGPDSRAEMVSPDQTITRVGQSTLFSFEPNSREIELQRGSILFQSPSGKGGGNIRTSAASAAVLGTTLIVITTQNGGFKVLLLEGKGRVRGQDGAVRLLKSGQMVYALPGGKLSNTLEFRLSQQVSASRLVGGFKRNLPSIGKIQAAVNKQEKEIAKGKAVATNLMASGSPNFAFRIDVARETAINAGLEVAPDPLTTAVTTDAVIDAPVLESTRLFGDGGTGAAIFASEFGSDSATPVRAERPAFFIGNNILFDSPTVDMTPFADRDLFQFLGINDIDVAQSVDFGMFPDREIQLLAGRTITAAPGTVIRGDGGQLGLVALGSTFPLDGTIPENLDDFSTDVPFELEDFGISNVGGGVALAGGDVQLTGLQFETHTDGLIAGGRDVKIDGFADGATLQGLPSPFDNGAPEPPPSFSTINAGEHMHIVAKRDVQIRRTAINSPSTVVQAGRVLKMTAVQINDGSVQPPPPDGEGQVLSVPRRANGKPGVYLQAKDLADLRSVNFFANDVLIQSNTIRLENVRFREGSLAILESQIGRLAGRPNSNAPVQPGMVNFVSGVRYGDAPAQQRLLQNGPSSEPATGGQGIIIRPLQK